MADWYALRDPRQFYYGAYVQNRARMQEGAEHNYAFFEKRNLADYLDESARQTLTFGLLPLRHVEQAANLHHMSGSAYGYGTAITQACLFAAMDRMGMAQYLSRIGLLIDGNSGASLAEAKQVWMEHEAWQGVRALCEEMLVQQDWFELFWVQSLLIDSHLRHVFYTALEQQLAAQGARDVAMLTEFMLDCLKDLSAWSDSAFKTVAAESEANRALLQSWLEKWQPKVAAAYGRVVAALLGDEAAAALTAAAEEINKRAAKAGVAV